MMSLPNLGVLSGTSTKQMVPVISGVPLFGRLFDIDAILMVLKNPNTASCQKISRLKSTCSNNLPISTSQLKSFTLITKNTNFTSNNQHFYDRTL